MDLPGWQVSGLGFFVIGLLGGGLTRGMFLSVLGGLLGAIPDLVGGVSLALVAVMMLAIDFGLLDIQLPQRRRQVPLSISVQGRVQGPLQFGFEMGTGVQTYVTAAFPYSLVCALALFGTWPAGILAGAGFAIGRALMPLLREFSGRREAWETAYTRGLDAYVRVCSLAGLALIILTVR